MSGHNAKHNVILGWILAVLVFIVSSLFSVAGVAQKMPATVSGRPLKGVNVNGGKILAGARLPARLPPAKAASTWALSLPVGIFLSWKNQKTQALSTRPVRCHPREWRGRWSDKCRLEFRTRQAIRSERTAIGKNPCAGTNHPAIRRPYPLTGTYATAVVKAKLNISNN